MNYEEGCRMPSDEWLTLNRTGIFENAALRRYVSPFPPTELMGITSGVQSETGFAAHGIDIYAALACLNHTDYEVSTHPGFRLWLRTTCSPVQGPSP